MTFKFPPCEFCNEEVDPRQLGVFRHVEGWVENRTGGGANALTLMIDHKKYAHPGCIVKEKKGHNQPSMF